MLGAGCPPAGRTYRYWKGEEPLYDFGYGLSYVPFNLTGPSITLGADTDDEDDSQPAAAGGGTAGGASSGGGGLAVTAGVTVVSSDAGAMPADTSVLVFMEYVGPGREEGPEPRATLAASGCSSEASHTDLVRRLVAYRRTRVLDGGEAQQLSFTLRLAESSRSSWAGFGEDPAAPPCGAYALRFGAGEEPAATVVLA